MEVFIGVMWTLVMIASPMVAGALMAIVLRRYTTWLWHREFRKYRFLREVRTLHLRVSLGLTRFDAALTNNVAIRLMEGIISVGDIEPKASKYDIVARIVIGETEVDIYTRNAFELIDAEIEKEKTNAAP